MKQMLRAREVAFEMPGVKMSASNEELKSAYRRARLKYHPDRKQQNPDVDNKFLTGVLQKFSSNIRICIRFID